MEVRCCRRARSEERARRNRHEQGKRLRGKLRGRKDAVGRSTKGESQDQEMRMLKAGAE